jgi:hypothetical protein
MKNFSPSIFSALMLDDKTITDICDVLSEHTCTLYDKAELLPFMENYCKPPGESVHFVIGKPGAEKYQEKILAALEAKLKAYCAANLYWNEQDKQKGLPGKKYIVKDLDPIELFSTSEKDIEVRAATALIFVAMHMYTARSDNGNGLDTLKLQFPARD